jgi:hypothetical protein
MVQSKNEMSDLVNLLSRPGFHADGDPELTIVQAWFSGEGDDLDGVSETVALAAVEAASRQGRLDLLTRTREGGSSRWLRKAAARAIHAARTRGVASIPAEAARVFHMEGQAMDPVRKAFLMPMPAGWLLFLTASEGDVHLAAWTELDRVGKLLRIRILRGDRSKMRSTLRDLTRDAAMAELPFVSGLTLGLRAVEAPSAERSGGPISWLDFLQIVPEPTTQAARILDPWRDFEREFDLAKLKADAQYAIERCPPDAISDRETVDAIGDRLLEVTSQLYLRQEAASAEVIERMLHDFIEEKTSSGPGRENLAESFDLHALYRRQRSLDDEARMFRASALALRDGIPGHEIPLVRAYFQIAMALAMERLEQIGAEAAEE